MEDERREKKTGERMNQQTQPCSADILDGLHSQTHEGHSVRRAEIGVEGSVANLPIHENGNRPHLRSIQPPPTWNLTNISGASQRMKNGSANQKLSPPPTRIENHRRLIPYGGGDACKTRGRRRI